MGKAYEQIDDRWKKFIAAQKLFFVSTAPLAQDGLINCSPKGLDSLRIIDELTIAYIDLTGSGAETIANLKENGRITFMFCAFEGPPKILRIYGQGEVLEKGSARYDELICLFPNYRSARAIIKTDITKIIDACGYAVPLYDFIKDRDTMEKWVEKKDDKTLIEYHKEKNAVSLNGLPALDLDY